VFLAAVVTGCGSGGRSAEGVDGSTTSAAAVDTTVVPTTTTTTAPTTAPPTTPAFPAIAPPVPGPAHVLNRVAGAVGKVALTFDDGSCGDCIATMVAALERTGAHATFCPNGTYGRVWQPYVERIRALLARGQLELCNHTWDHPQITRISAGRLSDEIAHDEQWIEDTFGVTARPYFRPPYGARSSATDAVAGRLGFTTVLIWSSTLSDSVLQPPATILDQLQRNLVPGGVVLGHLNYPTTGQVFDQILAVLAQRGLVPVTISELVAAGG
jgi:peptidoglycan/xylan/chitin deacetylase (PgdA/CDA1 family)